MSKSKPKVMTDVPPREGIGPVGFRRRDVLSGGALGGIALATGMGGLGGLMVRQALAQPPDSGPITNELFQSWVAEWQLMEDVVKALDFKLPQPVKIAAPTSAIELASLERAAGVKFPEQLATVLTQHARAVHFSWQVPAHRRALDGDIAYPTRSGLHRSIWDVAEMAEFAIPNFLGWKRDLKDREQSEAKNVPEMWDNQFPFASLVNGDMLTIDVSDAEGARQLVRYFSHKLEGVHGYALAPNFATFMTVFSKLGCAGTEQDSLSLFMPKIDHGKRTAFLSATDDGAFAWVGWLTRAGKPPKEDEPPHAIVEKTTADRALLTAARAGRLDQAAAALSAGAVVDCVPSSDWIMDTGRWGEEFSTALIYAVHNSDLNMLDALLSAGASLNTRRLSVGVAVEHGTLQTLRWLVEKGARANGWKSTRHWPLHLLIERRGKATPQSMIAKMTSLTEAGVPAAEAMRLAPKALPRSTYLEMVDALLKAGAEPDAPWDNGLTMLMRADGPTMKLLLRHGADVHARDVNGQQAIHFAQGAAEIDVLVAHGADVNSMAVLPKGRRGSRDVARRPLQLALMMNSIRENEPAIEALLRHGADPKLRDGAGRSVLAYCRKVGDLKRFEKLGLDPKERLPDGGTLLHNLVAMSGRATFKQDDFFKYLLAQGLGINETNSAGQTVLHVLVASGLARADDVAALLALGADASLRDSAGKNAFDLAPKSQADVRALLQF